MLTSGMSVKLLAASLVAGAVILVVAFSLESKPLYSYSVGDFLKQDLRAREVKVQGVLVHGSLCKVDAGCGYRFAIAGFPYWQDASEPSSRSVPVLDVSYEDCALPDTFRDIPGYDITVTVQGERCEACHEFSATKLMAKCPGKYQRPLDGEHLAVSPIPRCPAPSPRL